MTFNYHRIVIKVGSNVLTKKNGLPDAERIGHLVEQIVALKKQGKEVILISSGAVASGRGLITVSEKYNAIAARQLLASVGQVRLINNYARLFELFNILCAQVLVTREDFRDRTHYLNMKNCLEILLQHEVIPVVNENDVVSVTELMFTDNDELAGLIASMLNAQALIILTNVDGIFDGDPEDEGSSLIEEIKGNTVDFSSFVNSGQSQFGRGGMITKSTIAQKLARLGINVHIANGTKKNILADVLDGEAAHTHFQTDKKASGKKKWIAHSGNFASGVVKVNQGAKAALMSGNASSLLPVGVLSVIIEFKKGEIIKLIDESENMLGFGVAEYGADKLIELIGQKNKRPIVHYDYLYIEC